MPAGAIADSTSKHTSVDALLENVNDFIQSVYRDVALLSPVTSSTSSTRNLNYRVNRSPETSPLANSNSSSVNSSTSETEFNLNIPGDTERRLTYSPRNRRNIDADIERINRICDNVDLNLRSIGINVNERRCDHPAAVSSNHEVFARPAIRRSDPSSTPDDIDGFVDLSNTQTETPQPVRPAMSRRQINYTSDADDDEVVVVSSNIPPIIDLCTPGNEEPRRRTSSQRRCMSRRALDQSVSLAEELPVRRRRLSKKPEAPSPSCITPDEETTNEATPDRNPFVCPVCMDSCLRRRPTSTKCGHVYCEQCIKQAIRLTHKCPLCNTKISEKNLIRIYL